VLNTLCHYKKFQRYVSIESDHITNSTKCYEIKGCSNCGFDNVDNITKIVKNIDQTSLKLKVKCTGKIEDNVAEPIKGYNRIAMPPIKILSCDDTLTSLKSEDDYIYGNPGSSFLVFCPDECKIQSDMKVYGNS